MKKREVKFYRILALLLALTLAFPFLQVTITKASTDDAKKYVSLDTGTWNFKVYRTYSKMFQYLPYAPDGSLIKWEDKTLSQLPDKAAFQTWESLNFPADDTATGGLLPIVRDNGKSNTEPAYNPEIDFFPSWSEAWVCRTFDLPSDFTKEENVTLLLGIIDDMDVVYINGQPVASSGFKDGNGQKKLPVASGGGFNYNKASAPQDQVLFEKSYWEVQREYSIPTSVLNLGGENEICIRIYNNNSYGGFYSGNTYAICGNDLAVRAAKNLPTNTVEIPAFKEITAKQIQAFNSKNLEAYAQTIDPNYSNQGKNKASLLTDLKSQFEAYETLTVTDDKPGYYLDEKGRYVYSAIRTMTGTSADGTVTLQDHEEIELYYTLKNGEILECGDKSRCFPVTYNSGLFEKELSYSIYLPDGYWENTSQKYPVVYLLHGINSSSSSFINVDRIQDYMDQWISSGSIVKMIVVMPDSGKNSFYRDSEYDPDQADSTGPWQTHIVKEIRNEIETNYRTLNDVRFRGITGISMGGFGAMTIGTQYPDLFSSVASHMGFLPEEALASLQTLTDQQLKNYDFYVDCGLQDGMVDYKGTVSIHNYLDSKNIAHGYDLRDGGHNSAFYMQGMPLSMKMHSDHFKKNGLYPAPSPDYNVPSTDVPVSDASTETIKNEDGTTTTIVTAVTKNNDGSTLTTQTKTTAGSDQKVKEILRTETIEKADGSKTVTTKQEIKTEDGKTTASVTSAPANTKASIKNITKRQSLRIYVGDTAGLTEGKKAYVYVVDSKTGKYLLLPTTNYTVDKEGKITLPVTSSGNYAIFSSAQKGAVRLSKQISIRGISKTKSIKKGKSYTLKYALPSTIKKVSKFSKTEDPLLAEAKVTFKSSNKKIASVSKSGKITAKKKGKVSIKITFTLDDNIKKSFRKKITVK